MSTGGELKESAVASNTVLGTLGDSRELIFVFGVSFQSPSMESAHSARRDPPVVSFRIVSKDRLVLPVSHTRKGNCAPRAEDRRSRASCSGVYQDLLWLESYAEG